MLRSMAGFQYGERFLVSAPAFPASIGEPFQELAPDQPSTGGPFEGRSTRRAIVGDLSLLEAHRRAYNARSAMIGLRNECIPTGTEFHLAWGGDFAHTPAPSPQLSRIHD